MSQEKNKPTTEERKRTLEELLSNVDISKLGIIDRMPMRTSRVTMSSQIEHTFGWKNGLLRKPIQRANKAHQ